MDTSINNVIIFNKMLSKYTLAKMFERQNDKNNKKLLHSRHNLFLLILLKIFIFAEKGIKNDQEVYFIFLIQEKISKLIYLITALY